MLKTLTNQLQSADNPNGCQPGYLDSTVAILMDI